MSLRAFTLNDIVARNAALHGARTAFACNGETVTHAQYAVRVARLAAGLAEAGLGAGDRVAVLAANCLEYVDLFGAAARLGAIVVPINVRLSADEAAFVVADVQPRVLVAGAELCPLLEAQAAPPAAPDAARYAIGAAVAGWQPFASLYAAGNDGAIAAAAIDGTADLLILHTAAVGGRPRGARLSHGNLLAANLSSLLAWRLGPDDVNVGALPLFHLAGIGLLLCMQQAGGATRLLTRFDAPALVRHIDEDGGSLLGSFPPMLGALLDVAAAQRSRLAALRIVTGIETPETIARLQSACPAARFWSAYGQTETSGSISLAPFAERPGSAGLPTALSTVAIVDELDRQVPPGTAGEIVVRGPMVFQGYWRRPADDAATFRNGWHHTGDLGRLDAGGYLWYGGRSPAKELIKPGGENVYPAEVERALLEHPALAEAVVIGVPDARWGEAVKAVCVLKAGQALGERELIDFAGQHIARYKKPSQVVFVLALPKTADGAIDRAAVKARHGTG